MIGVTVLGSTGSVGVSTLEVLARHRQEYRVIALSAGRNKDLLHRQCVQWRPDYAVMEDGAAALELERSLLAAGLSTRVLTGREGLNEVARAPQTDYVMAAIVGAAGLDSSLAAARAGKRVMLANKEALVMAGSLFMEAIAAGGAELMPIDSEHNALFQCLPAATAGDLDGSGVSRLLLTGSGGPFLETSPELLVDVTPEHACAHPNWRMGRKISVDSATMMNKGLEVIEACWLFATGIDRVEVVIHPQSVIHSMVEYVDGSVLAQLGNPDMRTPIAHALAWPRRMASGVSPLDLYRQRALEFREPDAVRFPCLALAREAFIAGGTFPAVLNAANEEAVEAFLTERVRFTDIPKIIEATLATAETGPSETLQAVLAGDAEGRRLAREQIRQRQSGARLMHV